MSDTSAISDHRNEIYAVRRGKDVSNCLFFTLDDARPQIDGCSFAEYRIVHSMEEGRQYLAFNRDTTSHAIHTSINPHVNVDSCRSSTSDSCDETNTSSSITSNHNKSTVKLPPASWIHSLNELQAYRDTTGSFDIVPNDPKLESLRKWLYEQTYQYKQLKEGKKSHMNEYKLQMFHDIGFEFDYEPWEVRFAQLKAFHEKYGHLDLSVDPTTRNCAGLEKWLNQQMSWIVNASKGKNISLSDDQMNRLISLGINVDSAKADLGVKAKSKMLRVESAVARHNWDRMFHELETYKSENGHLNVSFSENKSLASWIVTQRTEYKKLKNGQSNRMTAVKMQKLTELGFQFAKRPSYKSWDERLEQLKNFHAKHGHVRIPVSDVELGEFVSRMRQEYNKFQDGKKSSLNDERIQALADLGFLFCAGKRPQTNTTARRKKKTWDERLEELVAYRNKNGHCLVPQHTSLGEWGHKQRSEYKKLKNGQPTKMTAIKIQKLTELGFIFDASNHRRKRKVQDLNQTEQNVLPVTGENVSYDAPTNSNFHLPFIEHQTLAVPPQYHT
jgi:hypothetical protein